MFSKDNEKTIAHQEFIEVVLSAVQKVFPHHSITEPEIRVSHQIKGRIPSAIHKPVKELLEHEKTIYYERMAFIIKVPAITDIVNGNELSLTIGGVRCHIWQYYICHFMDSHKVQPRFTSNLLTKINLKQ